MINTYNNASNWEEKDLIELIDGSIPEGKTIEYKSQLPGGSDDEKREFLSDVSSFANTEGGVIIYGLEEVGGTASSIPGVSSSLDDKTILAFEQSILQGISPRIPRFESKITQLANGNKVFILSIQRSWINPHMVTYKNVSRFYMRNSAGKYQMDVSEIKEAFLKANTFQEQIEKFRIDRIQKLLSNSTPIPYKMQNNIVMHFIPLDSFHGYIDVDFSANPQKYGQLKTTHDIVNYYRQNFSGLASAVVYKEFEYVQYVQYFRNGVVEIVDGDDLSKNPDGKVIPDILFERSLFKGVSAICKYYEDCGINPPIYCFITLVNVRGFTMARSNYNRHLSDTEVSQLGIDSEILYLPEIVINDLSNEDPSKYLRQPINLVWNAAGLPQSTNFNSDGSWKHSIAYL